MCHGAKTLVAAGVLDGRTRWTYPACRGEAGQARGRYADIAVDEDVTSGNLLTPPPWHGHPAWINQFMAVLGTMIVH
jgi:protease I